MPIALPSRRDVRRIVMLVLGSIAAWACPSLGDAQEATKPILRAPTHAFTEGYLRGPNQSRVIVFVNGVLGDAKSTWMSSSGAYWPFMLMDDHDFDDTDIYVHTFVSPPIASAQTIQELANRMQNYLDVDRVLASHKEVVFLAHSMGGLVTRAFLVAQRPPPAKVPMIFFFATPTTGANVAGIGKLVSRNPQFENMRPMKYEGYVAQLQDQWLQTSADQALDYPDKIASFCAYEKLDYFGVRVVEQASATNLCNRRTTGILADHIDIVKPDSDRSEPYITFKAAYRITFGIFAQSIYKALAGSTAPLNGDFQITYLSSKGELRAKRQTVHQTAFDVGCAQRKSGIVEVPLKLEPGEEIIGVAARVDRASNLKRSLFAVESFDRGKIFLRYSVQGLDRPFPFYCPASGNADVSVSYIVESK